MNLFFVIMFIVVGGLVYYFTKDITIMILFLSICASNCTNTGRVLRFVLKTSLIMLLGVIFLNKIGVLPNTLYYTADGQIRNSLGFLGFGQISFLTFFSVICYCLIRGDKFNIKDLLIGTLVSIMGYIVTRDNTTLILIVAMLCLTWAINYKKTRFLKKIIQIVAIMAFPMFFVLMFVLSSIFDYSKSSWVNLNNNIFHGRLYLSHEALKNFPIKFWGQNIPQIGLFDINQSVWGGSSYFYIDSSYLRILLMYGSISFIVIGLIFICLAVRANRSAEGHISIAILILSIYGIMSPYMYQIGFNPIFLILFAHGSVNQSKVGEAICQED